MKNLIHITACIIIACVFSSCWSVESTKSDGTYYYASMGEDTTVTVRADNVTRTETSPTPPTIVMNAKGSKILAVIPADPLAGIATASGLHITWGKNQSTSFGNFWKSVTQTASGWFTLKGLEAYTAADVAKTQSANKLAGQVAKEETARSQIAIGSKLADKVPAEEAAGALGSVLK